MNPWFLEKLNAFRLLCWKENQIGAILKHSSMAWGLLALKARPTAMEYLNVIRSCFAHAYEKGMAIGMRVEPVREIIASDEIKYKLL